MNKRQMTLAVSLALITTACGESVSETMRGIGEAVKSLDLQRQWVQSSCTQSGVFRLIGASRRTTYSFLTNDLKKTDQYYSDANCTQPGAAVVYSGTFEKKELAALPDLYAINFSLNRAEVTARNAEGVNVLNDTNFCGKRDWVVNVPADMTNRTRDLFCPLKNLPENSYTVYAVRDGALFLGKGDVQSKVENRPTELDLEMPYGQSK